MKYLIIGSTCINRTILHKETYPEWIKWISNLKNFKIIWFINIDLIKNLDSTYQEVVDFFLNFKNNYDIDIKFLNSQQPNFLSACKRVSNEIYKFIVFNNAYDSLIFWLEDDWKFNNVSNIDPNILINLMPNYSNLNLTYIRNNYMHALAPAFWTYNAFKNILFDAWKNEFKTIDPEHCAGLYFIKKFGKAEDINNLTIISKKVSDGFIEKTKCINYKNSYFSYLNNLENNIINEKYIKSNDIKLIFCDIPIFIRITPSFVIDGVNFGREFMKNYNLKKKGKGNLNDSDFYE